VKIRDDDAGAIVVARVYGGPNSTAGFMPDGRLVWFKGKVYTDEPFRADTIDELERKLTVGTYQGFAVTKGQHYLVYSKGSKKFTEQSTHLLESLYKGLLSSLGRMGFDVHDAEFPLVAVIYRTEADFRAQTKAEREVEAFYDALSNRFFMYEIGDHDQDAPDVAALHKPQTVAHEGTHQILQNIGLQPRLAMWPPWVIEGMAEFCAPTKTNKGAEWAGFGVVNPFHMTAYHDLRDEPITIHHPNGQTSQFSLGPRWIEDLVGRQKLTPIEYSLSWSLTYYLAKKRPADFIGYLKTLSQIPPLDKVSSADHVRNFRAAFGSDFATMRRSLDAFLKRQKYDPIPYYAVGFVQQLPGGVVRRASIVSPSPSMIRQWVENTTEPNGGPIHWEARPYPTRRQAQEVARQWMGGGF
jgi:hypothetical protein